MNSRDIPALCKAILCQAALVMFARRIGNNAVVTLLFVLGAAFVPAFAAPPTTLPLVGNPDGDLRIEIITAPNLIVDSNVESPSTYAPTAFHVGVRYCNEGTDTLWNVFMYIGDFNAGTPGTYPSRTHPGLTGTFSLVHEGGSSAAVDATRFVPFIAPGECFNQFWLISYPRLDDNGNSVTQATNNTDDDLWLNFDVWATANDNGTPLAADTTGTVTMRNEISAMANKIWPNTDSKVPEEYLQVIMDSLGWDAAVAGGGNPIVGEPFTIEGIWYDFGVVNQGFDNDGDFVPDYNAWMQPVGDPSQFDADSYRLVGMFGLLIVKLIGGGEILIPFEDRLYFSNLPPNNGVVGLVYYRFMALDGAEISNMTPYQEVASGSDNEKFNGDFGRGIPMPVVEEPQLDFEKNVSPTSIASLPSSLTFTINFSNNGTKGIGMPTLGVPFVVQDSIPSGTAYVAGSATASNTLPAGVSGFTMLYSDDNGLTWTNTEPPAATVTDLRWMFNNTFPAGTSGSVQFQVMVPTNSSGVAICNEAGAMIGFSSPFVTDEACAFLPGNNSIGDLVWEDDGGTTGTAANGIRDGNEAALPNAPLELYYDVDGDGVLDVEDILFRRDTSDAAGAYLFTGLPDGEYIVAVCNACVRDLPGYTGWGSSTDDYYAAALDTLHASGAGVSSLVNDFGFVPALQINKVLNSGTPTYGDREVSYTIQVQNNLPAPPGSECTQTAWSTVLNAGLSTNNGTVGNAIGVPDGTYATDNQWHNFRVAGQDFNFTNPVGSIAKVELLFRMYHTAPVNNETIVAKFLKENNTIYTSASPTLSEINQYVGASNVHDLVFDVTSAQAWDWTVFDNAWYSQINFIKTQAGDGSDPFVDAIGVRVTPAGCSESLAYDPDVSLSPVPVSDDYDPARLQFVSATPEPDSINTTTGYLAWDDIGPVNGGQTKYISLTFNALQPLNLTQGDSTLNIAASNGARFGSGEPANNDIDTVGLRVLRSGSIAGVIWSDIDNDGWQGTNGYENTDLRLENIAVVLNTCTSVAANGTCNGVLYTDTLYTDNNGAYLFEGLAPNLYYSTNIVTSTLPGTFTQRGDPDDDPNNGSGNGGTCGNGGGNAACDNTWDRNKLWFRLGTNSWGGQSWDVVGINFGYSVQPAIFGNVWEDVDGDGIQEEGENPMAGVTVELRNGTCTPGVNCATTTTDSDGDYFFENLSTGSYTIVVTTSTLPAGATWTVTAESDGTTNNSISETLTAGEYAGSHDFGFHATGTASVGDLVYYDFDGDGVKDASEVGIANISVNLYRDLNDNGVYDDGVDAFVASTTTNASGAYLFSNLPPSDYVVVVDETDPDMPESFLQTADPTYPGITCPGCDGTGSATLTTTAVLTLDFGFQPVGVGQIGDHVWVDSNGDGVVGPSETPIQGISVLLYADLNNDGNFELVATTTTDADGNYLFENLPDGDYRVDVDNTDPDLPTDGAGIAYTPTTDTSFTVEISGGEVTSLGGTPCTNCADDADFGFAALAAVGDFLFWDANQNGSQDWTEDGIPNITVRLYDEDDNLVATTATSDGSDGNPIGYYFFAGLLPGNYYVTVDAADPDLGGATLMADPSSDGVPCTHPDANQCDNRYDFSLTYGNIFAGVDFGYLPSGVIGDYIWLDSDNDGVQDGGEPGVANILVRVTNQTPVTINGTNYPAGTYSDTTYTDLDGRYTFSNLPDGTWTVQAQPGGTYLPTFDADGTPNNTTNVVISGGNVTSTGNTWCSNPDCSLDLDFGVKLNGSFTLSGSICIDDNTGDGTCGTGGEALLDSLVVNLYNNAGVFLGSTYTNASGAYTFSGLPAGTYYVSIGTTQNPLPLTDLTTTADDTPATVVTTYPASVVQTVPITGSTTGVDFAFQFNVDIDFGDLPVGYPVSLSDGPVGAYHILDAMPTLYLGTSVDGESDGTNSADADADDATGDDENGVTFISPESWTVGEASNGDGGTATVAVVGSGWLVAWFDFNNDQSFVGDGEMVVSQAVTTGTLNLSFDIPTGTVLSGEIFARFRLFETEPILPVFAYAGEAENGEVEDYKVEITTCPAPVCPPVILTKTSPGH